MGRATLHRFLFCVVIFLFVPRKPVNCVSLTLQIYFGCDSVQCVLSHVVSLSFFGDEPGNIGEAGSQYIEFVEVLNINCCLLSS